MAMPELAARAAGGGHVTAGRIAVGEDQDAAGTFARNQRYGSIDSFGQVRGLVAHVVDEAAESHSLWRLFDTGSLPEGDDR